MADIIYVYSDPTGDGTNSNPKLSLGGSPSVALIAGNVIFSDVTGNQSAEGITQYRCIYIVNDSATDTFYNCLIYIAAQVVGGATVQIGFKEEAAIQLLFVTNSSLITGGDFTLTYTDYEPHEFTVSYDSDVEIWAENFQNELRNISGLEDVEVTAIYDIDIDTTTFQIMFLGAASNRNQQIIEETSNDLTYSGEAPILSFESYVNGGPINAVADVIDVETTVPTGVAFTSASYNLGTFMPYDIVPVWIKRTVEPNTEGLENDGFTLRFRGDTTP